MFWVSMESYDNGFLDNIYNSKHHFEFPIGKFWFKIGKIGKNRDFFVGGQNLKFFEILFFLNLCMKVKVNSENSDF